MESHTFHTRCGRGLELRQVQGQLVEARRTGFATVIADDQIAACGRVIVQRRQAPDNGAVELGLAWYDLLAYIAQAEADGAASGMGGNDNAEAYRQSNGRQPNYSHEFGIFTIIETGTTPSDYAGKRHRYNR